MHQSCAEWIGEHEIQVEVECILCGKKTSSRTYEKHLENHSIDHPKPKRFQIADTSDD